MAFYDLHIEQKRRRSRKGSLLMTGRSRGRLGDKEPVGLRGVTERRRGLTASPDDIQECLHLVALSLSTATRDIQERDG
jgi:hypothetical protein